MYYKYDLSLTAIEAEEAFKEESIISSSSPWVNVPILSLLERLGVRE